MTALCLLHCLALHSHEQVSDWPIYAMATAGECQGALSDFYRLWFATLDSELTTADQKQPGKTDKPNPLSLKQLFKKVQLET